MKKRYLLYLISIIHIPFTIIKIIIIATVLADDWCDQKIKEVLKDFNTKNHP